MKRLVTLFIVALMAAPAFAQVPQDGPDDDGRDWQEEQKERWKEAHREELQHLFVSMQAGAGTPFRTVDGPTLGLHQAFGWEFGSGHIVSMAVDAYSLPAAPEGSTSYLPREHKEMVGVLSMQYHHNLRAFAPQSVHAQRTTVVMGGGIAFGDSQGATLALTPTYTLPINRYWSLPVGVKVSHLFVDGGASAAQQTFFGIQVGVRYHPFAYRDRLE